MAEVIETSTGMLNKEDIPSQGKANAGLTLGIIGTALALFNGSGILGNLFGNKSNSNSTSNTGNATDSGYTDSMLTLERAQCQKYLDITTNYYKNRISDILDTNAAFATLKQADIDNSFMLYKNQRDNFDLINSEIATKNAELANRISALETQTAISSAVRPYQDALINARIDTVAAEANYNLERKTCKMIQGIVTLPSTPTVTGLVGYPYYYNINTSTGTTTTA